MANISEEITTWLKSLKGWQTELAYRILTKECLNDADYSVLLEMLKGNSSFSAKEFPVIGVQSTNSGHKIRLRSIEAINNIEKLAPRKPLLFGEQNMVVVYGNNGSGKSGITRILKKTCGKPNAKDLKNNIYKANLPIGGCKIKYLNGEVEAEHDWQINGISISDLSCIDIYDSDTGTSYIKEAKSVSYTPIALALFESLSKEYGKIGSMLSSEKDQLIRRLPNLPANYAPTKAAQLFNNLNHSYSESNLAYINWTEDKQNELNVLTERLNQKNPQVAAKEKRTNKVEAEKILLQIQTGVDAISEQNHKEIVRLRKEAQAKRKVATESVATFQKDIELEGVGSETWRALWEAAKQYSEMEAYKDNDFPNITEGAKCVLCHQPIEERAKGRFISLNAFVEGTLENEARSAERLLEEVLTSLPQEINETDLRTKCNAAGLDDNWFIQLKDVWSYISKNIADIKSAKESLTDISAYISTAIGALKSHIERLEKEALQYDEDVRNFDRDKAQKDRLELEAIKWCFQQKEEILSEIQRLKTIKQYEAWMGETNTASVSRKASQVSEIIVTDDYIKRFNEELKKLGASKIQVELIKQNIVRGVPHHAIKLKGVQDHRLSPIDIFSEGEFRIISLAAFLADVTGSNNNNPFIFDDPISSLDQDFEEATVARLVELSNGRQVIVFTHRLSLLGLLYEACKKIDRDNPPINVITVKAETWGTGEPGEPPFFGKPEKEFNKFNKNNNNKLQEAKQVFENQGRDAYYPFAKAMCSDFRNAIERTIEYVLLADVVARHRRAVNTEGKIKNLAKISPSDCALIEELMTKYSRYEHSQSLESPVEMPEPTEIETDVTKIQSWLIEFKNRQLPA